MADYPHNLNCIMTKERETADVEYLYILTSYHYYFLPYIILTRISVPDACVYVYILDAMGSRQGQDSLSGSRYCVTLCPAILSLPRTHKTTK